MNHLHSFVASGVIFCLASWWCEPTRSAQAGDDQVPASRAEVLVVVGAAGEEGYGRSFDEWAERWAAAAESAAAEFTRIGPGGSVDDESARSDRDQLLGAIAKMTEESERPFWLVLIGHGTFSQDSAKFNLRGPDVSATELAEALALVERPTVVVNCFSASAPFINRLSGKNRIVVTATKSGAEINYSRFGDFFSAAIGSTGSDLDHDGDVSVLEAFLRASSEVEAFYQSEARLSTEHALIDDNGDSLGTPASMYRGLRPFEPAGSSKLDGSLARRTTLVATSGGLTLSPDELARRDQIERDLDMLRSQRDSMPEVEYLNRLESLLLPLAEIYAEAERRASSPPAD